MIDEIKRINVVIQYLFCEDHRHRTSSIMLTSDTGIIIVLLTLTMTYCGEAISATGGVLMIPSGRI